MAHTYADKIKSLRHWGEFTCTICGEPILPHEDIDFDHIVPQYLDGDHSPENLRPVHRECHRRKTSGTRATSYGSDVHEAAKLKRLRGETMKNKHKHNWPSRPLRGRGFERKRDDRG